MNYSIQPMQHEDQGPVMDIFNHYINQSFAAYRENPVSYDSFGLLFDAAGEYPSGVVRADDGQVLGFGLLKPHRPLNEFAHTAEVVYFLHPDHLGKGIGATLLKLLEEEGKKKGITILLANISSMNDRSLRFHEHHGFVECGRFKGIVKKKSQTFDVVWMQKIL